jgi:hypothetical protein
MKPLFELMRRCSTADMMRTIAFLRTLATAKYNREVWAFSDVCIAPNKRNTTLSFLAWFMATIQTVDRPETTLNPVTIISLSPWLAVTCHVVLFALAGHYFSI